MISCVECIKPIVKLNLKLIGAGGDAAAIQRDRKTSNIKKIVHCLLIV